MEQQPKEHLKGHRKVLKELQQTVFQDFNHLQVSSATFVKGISRHPKPTCKYNLLLQWNLSFGTPLFKGHLHSWDTKFGSGETPIL